MGIIMADIIESDVTEEASTAERLSTEGDTASVSHKDAGCGLVAESSIDLVTSSHMEEVRDTLGVDTLVPHVFCSNEVTGIVRVSLIGNVLCIVLFSNLGVECK